MSEDPPLPAPEPPAPTPPAEHINISEAAAVFEEAMPLPTAAPAGPTSPALAAFRDRRGNAFDPALHLVRRDGSPALSRAGRLMAKPGVKLPRGAGAVKGPKAPAPVASSLDAGSFEPSPVATEDGPPFELEETAAEPEGTNDVLAQIDAENLVQGEALLLSMLNGKLEPDDKIQLEASAKRALIADNMRLPIGPWTSHWILLTKLAVQKARTEEGRENLIEAINLLGDL